jgi:hypothetical protein
MYIITGGVILYAAVFLGIQAGHAFRGGATEITPDNLPNESLLSPGDPIPPLPLKTATGTPVTLAEAVGDRPTLVGVVMPGCTPCKQLLGQWQQGGVDGTGKYQVILVATEIEEVGDFGVLADYADTYPIYWCRSDDMDGICGITTFPSLIGMTADNTVGFVANGLVYQLTTEFFDKYL